MNFIEIDQIKVYIPIVDIFYFNQIRMLTQMKNQ